MTFAITNEVARRINQGIADAQRTIDCEMRYRADLRDMKLIAGCEAHIAKMSAAIAAGVLVAA